MKILNILFFSLVSISLFAQYDAFTYQGLILDATGEPLSMLDVEFEIIISKDLANQEVFLEELHATKTDEDGVVSFNVGQGFAISGSMEEIPWLDGIPYMTVNYILEDGKGLRNLGTQQFDPVLFSLSSKYVICQDGPAGPQGPEGPVGPQTSDGAQGPQGDQGPQGQDGRDGLPIMPQQDEAPQNVFEGAIYLDSGANRVDNKPGFRYFDGMAWIDLG